MIRHGRKQTNWQPPAYQGVRFFIHGLWAVHRQALPGRTQCVNRARRDLWGIGNGIPTATC